MRHNYQEITQWLEKKGKELTIKKQKAQINKIIDKYKKKINDMSYKAYESIKKNQEYVLGKNYDSWETLSVKWFSDPADLSSQEGDCYCLGYIARG